MTQKLSHRDRKMAYPFRSYCFSLIESFKSHNTLTTLNWEEIEFFLSLVDKGIETRKSPRELALHIKNFLAEKENVKV